MRVRGEVYERISTPSVSTPLPLLSSLPCTSTTPLSHLTPPTPLTPPHPPNAGEQQQLEACVVDEGGRTLVDWRAVAAERHRLRRNWLKGRFTVRTFLGHEQGEAGERGELEEEKK